MDGQDTVALADEERQHQGPWEVELSYGDEADLHRHVSGCAKNPGHMNFIPVTEFSIEHLPHPFRDQDLVDCIRALADVTVRVSVGFVSSARPRVFPGSSKAYPCYTNRGRNLLRVGTGYINLLGVINNLDGVFCQCYQCSQVPREARQTVFAVTEVRTAAHLVFDEAELEATSFDLFYDRGNTITSYPGVVTVTGNNFYLVERDVEGDILLFNWYTHDLNLVHKIQDSNSRFLKLKEALQNKFRNLCADEALTVESDYDKELRDTLYKNMKELEDGLSLTEEFIKKQNELTDMVLSGPCGATAAALATLSTQNVSVGFLQSLERILSKRTTALRDIFQKYSHDRDVGTAAVRNYDSEENWIQTVSKDEILLNLGEAVKILSNICLDLGYYSISRPIKPMYSLDFKKEYAKGISYLANSVSKNTGVAAISIQLSEECNLWVTSGLGISAICERFKHILKAENITENHFDKVADSMMTDIKVVTDDICQELQTQIDLLVQEVVSWCDGLQQHVQNSGQDCEIIHAKKLELIDNALALVESFKTYWQQMIDTLTTDLKTVFRKVKSILHIPRKTLLDDIAMNSDLNSSRNARAIANLQSIVGSLQNDLNILTTSLIEELEVSCTDIPVHLKQCIIDLLHQDAEFINISVIIYMALDVETSTVYMCGLKDMLLRRLCMTKEILAKDLQAVTAAVKFDLQTILETFARGDGATSGVFAGHVSSKLIQEILIMRATVITSSENYESPKLADDFDHVSVANKRLLKEQLHFISEAFEVNIKYTRGLSVSRLVAFREKLIEFLIIASENLKLKVMSFEKTSVTTHKNAENILNWKSDKNPQRKDHKDLTDKPDEQETLTKPNSLETLRNTRRNVECVQLKGVQVEKLPEDQKDGIHINVDKIQPVTQLPILAGTNVLETGSEEIFQTNYESKVLPNAKDDPDANEKSLAEPSMCSSQGVQPLIVIVSHPHGCSKQVSIGRCVSRYVVNTDHLPKAMTMLTYDTATCPGTSGAYVVPIGTADTLNFFVHNGNNAKLNYSSFVYPALEKEYGDSESPVETDSESELIDHESLVKTDTESELIDHESLVETDTESES